MKIIERPAQEFAVEMGIDFGGGDAFVSQHFLYGAQVGAALYQVGGERMAETMGRYDFADTGFLHQVFDHQENHDPRKPRTSLIEEQYIFRPGLDRLVHAYLVFIKPDMLARLFSDRHQTFLVAFTNNTDKAHIEVEL